MLFVTIVTTEVNYPGFHFLKKECNSPICFSQTQHGQEYLKNPRGPLSFSQNKIIKNARYASQMIKEMKSNIYDTYIKIRNEIL